jgi:hypothetical protein
MKSSVFFLEDSWIVTVEEDGKEPVRVGVGIASCQLCGTDTVDSSMNV